MNDDGMNTNCVADPGREIIVLEESLVFEEFTHRSAWDIAMEVLDEYDKLTSGLERRKGLGIRITVDNVLIFQYLMDGKKDDVWLIRKENTVMKMQHSSMYIRVVNDATKKYADMEEDENYAICGGGFPIYIGTELRGSICVSGLEHQDDHQLIISAIEACKKKGVIK